MIATRSGPAKHDPVEHAFWDLEDRPNEEGSTSLRIKRTPRPGPFLRVAYSAVAGQELHAEGGTRYEYHACACASATDSCHVSARTEPSAESTMSRYPEPSDSITKFSTTSRIGVVSGVAAPGGSQPECGSPPKVVRKLSTRPTTATCAPLCHSCVPHDKAPACLGDEGREWLLEHSVHISFIPVPALRRWRDERPWEISPAPRARHRSTSAPPATNSAAGL